MSAFRRHIQLVWKLDALKPEIKSCLIGAGRAFDPLPVRWHVQFVGNDEDALRRDWDEIGDVLRLALGQLNPELQAEDGGRHRRRVSRKQERRLATAG